MKILGIDLEFLAMVIEEHLADDGSDGFCAVWARTFRRHYLMDVAQRIKGALR